MGAFTNEIDHNSKEFFSDWSKCAVNNWLELSPNDCLTKSYRRLCCLQAIKENIIIPHYNESSAAFFIEAHNDALLSHVFASMGAWRTSMQSLRSVLENGLNAFYFRDHPIELELWESKQLQTNFTDLHKYFGKHPAVTIVPTNVTGLSEIRTEYSELSRAVHGSTRNFRMTDDAQRVLLWDTNKTKLSMWASRQRKAIEALVLLFITLHKEFLQGASNRELRRTLSFCVSAAKHTKIQQNHRVRILKP